MFNPKQYDISYLKYTDKDNMRKSRKIKYMKINNFCVYYFSAFFSIVKFWKRFRSIRE